MSDMEQSDVVAQPDGQAPEPVAPEQPAPEAVPVVAQQPSSASPTQQPEVAPEVDEAPLPLEDAVRALLIFVKGRRTVGDADLDAAIADVEAALPQDEQA